MVMRLDLNEILEKGPQVFVYAGIASIITFVLLYVLQYVGISISGIPTYLVAVLTGIIAAIVFKDKLLSLLGSLDVKDIMSVVIFSAVAYAIVGTISVLYGQIGMTASILGGVEIPAILSATKIVNLLINNAIIGGLTGVGMTIGYAISSATRR